MTKLTFALLVLLGTSLALTVHAYQSLHIVRLEKASLETRLAHLLSRIEAGEALDAHTTNRYQADLSRLTVPTNPIGRTLP